MSYTEKFPVGSWIGIVGREFLEEFKRSWKYRYRFGAPSWNARRRPHSQQSGFYHGGHVLYPSRWRDCKEEFIGFDKEMENGR
jgi:hypothetical protein